MQILVQIKWWFDQYRSIPVMTILAVTFNP